MSTSGGLNSLATIIKRLEAATSRLEDLAVTQSGLKPADVAGAGTPATPNSPAPASSSTAVASGSAAAPVAAASGDAPSVTAFDELVINGALKPWLDITRTLKSEGLHAQANDMEAVFKTQREFVVAASRCRKPDDKELLDLQTKLGNQIGQVNKTQENYRKEVKWGSFLNAVAQGAPVGAWVAPPIGAFSYVKELTDSTQYYTNRIVMEHKKDKEPDPKHPEWVKAYNSLFTAMQKYVKEYHTKELQWNPRGTSYKDYLASAGSTTTAPSAGGAPPPPPPPGPPPPPPPPPATAGGSAPASSGGGITAVFADLNKGENITKGLRKVEKSEMTHKNPELRAQGPVESKAPAASKRPAPPRKPQSLQTKKPPKLQLDGNKWVVEHYEGETVTVGDTEMGHTVNLYACKNATVVIKGKVNAVTLLNCTKTAVLIESVISSVSVTASPSFTIQITGTAPTVQIDNTDQGQIYLSKHCLDTVEVLTAKCSSINVSLPVQGEEEGVFDEKPLSEMIRTVVKNGQLVATVVEHSG